MPLYIICTSIKTQAYIHTYLFYLSIYLSLYIYTKVNQIMKARAFREARIITEEGTERPTPIRLHGQRQPRLIHVKLWMSFSWKFISYLRVYIYTYTHTICTDTGNVYV